MNHDFAYIDPRSYEDFYLCNGRGTRRIDHLRESSDSTKAKLIKDIQSARLEPVVGVVAEGLSEEQALVVEKTLIWKLG